MAHGSILLKKNVWSDSLLSQPSAVFDFVWTDKGKVEINFLFIYWFILFACSSANLEDGITHSTANHQHSLSPFSRTWRETTDIVHASPFTKNALQKNPRKK